jgi:hypothetical protein
VLLGVDIQQVLANIDVGYAARARFNALQSDIAVGAGEQCSRFISDIEARTDIWRRVDDQQPVGRTEQARHDKKRVGRGIAFTIQFQLVVKLGNFHLRGA